MNLIKAITFLLCSTLLVGQTTPIRNPQIQGASGSIVSGATLTNSGTFTNSGTLNGAGTFDFSSGTVTLPASSVTSGNITDGAIVNADINASAAIDITKLASSAITIAGTSTSLGGSITASAILDSISSTQGTILYRGASGWAALAPGTSGYFLKTQGAGANPLWAAASGSGSSTLATLTDVNLTSLADVDFLRYDSGTSKWINRTPANARTDLGLGALATLSEVASAQITDGTIVNADINASAAIAYTKMEAGSIFIYSTGGVMTKYSTLSAAKAAASSGQTIYVGPGTYAVTESLLKDGVNWHFAEGATVTKTTAVVEGMWDDGNTAITSVVTGAGVFELTSSANNYNAVVWTQHASSNVTIHCRKISVTQTVAGSGAPMGIWGRNGTLNVICSESISAVDDGATFSAIGVYWESGNMHVRSPLITSENIAVYPHSSAASTGDFFVDADIIEGTATDGTDQPGVILDLGENASAASWITARIIKSAGNAIGAVVNYRESKLYVTAQKIFGRVQNNDDIGGTAQLTYVEADKIEAVGNGGATAPSLIYNEIGTMRVTCRHWSPVSYTGETIKVTGGTVYIRGGDYTGGASANGIEVTAGTAEFEDMLVNTSANSGTNGATVSGGTAVFRDVRWTSHASGKDVAQSGGTATVNGGYGTGTGGVLTTSGTVAVVKNSLTVLTTDTTGNYVADVAGTSNEITSTHTPGEGSTATISLPATIDLGGKTSFEIPNGAAPTVDAFGEIAGDNDLWAASRGAPVFFDGTASTALVNVLVSDAPSNGQVPKWNTGGTITWEADNSGGTISGTDTQVMFFDGTDTPAGDAGMTYNKTTNVLTAAGFVGALTGNASTVTTNANMTGDVTSSGSNATTIAAMTAPGPLLAENASIRLDPAGSADGKYTGTTVTGTAGAALAFGDVVVLDVTDSRWELADANAAAAADGDSRALLGICVLAAAADGDPTTILLHGIVRADTAFPALTVGAPVYVGETAGDAVVTQPTTADVLIRVIGHALTADEMFFNPDNTWITHL